MRTVKSCLLAASLALLFFALPARAAVFNVTDTGEFIIALFLAESNGEGDTINVAAGTYDISSTLKHLPVGFGELLDIVGAGATTTILDGGGAVRVMLLDSDGDISISGITVRNGMGLSSSGGITAISTGGTFTLSDSVISGNTGSAAAGLDIQAASTVIDNTTISNNTATLKNCGGAKLASNSVAVTNSVISDNIAPTGYYGVGLRVGLTGPGNFTFSDNTVSGNSVAGACDATDTEDGVGVYAVAHGPVTFTRNLIDNNTTHCGSIGTGIYLVQNGTTETVVVADNIFSRNSAGPTNTDSAIFLYTLGGVLNIVNNTFSGNDSGAAAEADVKFDTAFDGAALNISNNIFYGAGGTDSLKISNDGDGNAVFSPTTFSNNLIDPAALTISPGGGVTESGSFFADPLFADPASGDFHISTFSPASDMGLASAPGIQTLDFDGEARVEGAAPDVGADESHDMSAPYATYNPMAGTVSIPDLRLGGTQLNAAKAAKIYEIQLTRLADSGYVFELTNFGKIAATKNPAATYNTTTQELDIPVVKVTGLKSTYHVTMQKRKGQFVFDVTSARKN